MAIKIINIVIITAVMTIIIIIMLIMRIKYGNSIKIQNHSNKVRSNQVKTMQVCLKGGNVPKAKFYWNEKDSKCKYQKQSRKNKK